jgi:hypothetical protein
MNTQIQVLRQKVDDVLALFSASLSEATDVEKARNALANSSIVATEREERLNNRELSLSQRQKDLDSQQKYIEEQSKAVQLALNKITVEKKALESLVEEKRQVQKERSELETEKNSFIELKAEKEKFETERDAFLAEKAFFAKEKLAMLESQKLLQIREQNIKQKEERIDKIERMTQV